MGVRRARNGFFTEYGNVLMILGGRILALVVIHPTYGFVRRPATYDVRTKCTMHRRQQNSM